MIAFLIETPVGNQTHCFLINCIYLFILFYFLYHSFIIFLVHLSSFFFFHSFIIFLVYFIIICSRCIFFFFIFDRSKRYTPRSISISLGSLSFVVYQLFRKTIAKKLFPRIIFLIFRVNRFLKD